jgi:hypothetical protein
MVTKAALKRLPAAAGLLLALTALTGCANPRSEAAHVAPAALVGMPKENLYACAGIPDRTDTMAGAERLTYIRRSTVTQVERDYDEFGPPLGMGGYRMIRPRTSVWHQNYQCEAIFTLRDGRVERIEYGAGRDLETCGTIVENCVPPTVGR